jgi:Ala-tRNA(Pro) deacylase
VRVDFGLVTTDRKTLFERLAELGIASTTVEHEPMFTVEQSQTLRESLPGAHTKNLFLSDKEGRAALVVAKDDTRVDLKLLASHLKFGRLSFGNAELLAKLLGVTPGSVTPFALINDCDARVTAVVDAGSFHLSRSIAIRSRTPPPPAATADLLRFIRACGHEPLVLALS